MIPTAYKLRDTNPCQNQNSPTPPSKEKYRDINVNIRRPSPAKAIRNW